MRYRATSLFLAFLAVAAPGVGAAQQQPPPADTAAADTVGVPVIVDRDTLFRLYGSVGAFTARERALAVTSRIEQIAGDFARRGDTVVVQDSENRSELIVGDNVIMTVLDEDALPLGIGRPAVARAYAIRITEQLRTSAERASFKTILLGAVYTAVAVLALLLAMWLIRRTFPRVIVALESLRGSRIPALRIQRFEILSSGRLTDFLIGIVKIVRVVLFIVLFYVFVTTVLGFFPWTEPIADRIASYVLTPLYRALNAFVDYLPNIFFIAVIALLTRYLLKFIRLFFNALESGAVELPGFYPDWAKPTYKIARFMVLAFIVVVIFPYLPGAGSDAFKGVSLFLGALFTLGSSSAISNVVAGTLLTYTRAFQIGDRVSIGETTGDVIERSLLVTRVRTIKNIDITIPNAMVLSSHITNFSTMAMQGGVILHTTVTIGYDAPWRRVQETLIGAALATEGILKEPKPFVLQTSLDDFYVSYQLNAYTEQPAIMARTYSHLHANIQDKFNETGIEILSPHYRAQRDGNQVTIPSDYLPKDYKAPAFRVESSS